MVRRSSSAATLGMASASSLVGGGDGPEGRLGGDAEEAMVGVGSEGGGAGEAFFSKGDPTPTPCSTPDTFTAA